MKKFSGKIALLLGVALMSAPLAAEAHPWGGPGPGYYGGGGGWHHHHGGFGRGFVGGLVGGVVGGALLNSFSGGYGYGGGYYTAPRPYIYTPPVYGYGYPPPVSITPQVTTTCTQTGYGTQICTQNAAPMVTYPGYGY